MSVTYAYAAEIVKSERDDNGDLIVYGKATGPDLDLDGQICDPTWLKSAMPAWMEWGNVREMHQPIAAGIGMELEAIGEDWWLKSKCIDPNTALKIESGVLKGYSVGIKSPRVIKDAGAPGGRINGGSIVEVSYVDRPCNPTAKMTICKSASSGGDLQPVERAGTPEAQAVAQHVEEESALGDAESESAEVEVVDPAEHPAAEDGTENPAAEPVGDEPNAASKSVGHDALRRVRKLVPALATLAKGTASEDIADARAAIAAIARLIESEAAGLAAGASCETYQIRTLLSAVEALEWFCEMESSEVEMVTLAADSMITKTSATDPVAPAPAADKSASAEEIRKAVAEASAASEERIKALEATLAKVSATPIPGGPVLARPIQHIAAAGHSAALAKAADYDRRAIDLRGTDHAASLGYAELARMERAKASTP